MANTDEASADAIARFEQTIEAERARLLQVHSVLHCLYEVLLYADLEDASTYADAAHLAAMLIDDAVARLDPVKLRPLMEAIQSSAKMEGRYAPAEPRGLTMDPKDDGSSVREPRVPFVYHSH